GVRPDTSVSVRSSPNIQPAKACTSCVAAFTCALAGKLQNPNATNAASPVTHALFLDMAPSIADPWKSAGERKPCAGRGCLRSRIEGDDYSVVLPSKCSS